MSSITITGVHARQILDSRGNPTVEVDVSTQQGQFRAQVPSGASTGTFEALELRDKGDAWMGKGVSMAVDNVNKKMSSFVVGMDPRNQKEIDELMVQQLDGTKNEYGWSKSKMGANAILGISMAVCRAGATAKNTPLWGHLANMYGEKHQPILPVPSFNVINGGSHAGNPLAFQEFMIMPTGARTYKEALQIGAECYHNLKKIIKAKYGQDATNIGDEGGFAPPVNDLNECWDLISAAVKAAGYTDQVSYAMDVAASEFYIKEEGLYDLKKKEKDNDGSGKITSQQLAQIYKDMIAKYPIVSIEDGFDEEDWKAWAEFNNDVGKDIMLVGDDLLVTNPTRIKRAIEEKSCNALLLKVNQIGSITEALEAVKLARDAGWGVFTSHRSGETTDTFIADLAVGFSTGLIKTGSPCRGERVCKYNQLLRIEEDLGSRAKYPGKGFRNPLENSLPY